MLAMCVLSTEVVLEACSSPSLQEILLTMFVCILICNLLFGM